LRYADAGSYADAGRNANADADAGCESESRLHADDVDGSSTNNT
jgi:hypothetical protein